VPLTIAEKWNVFPASMWALSGEIVTTTDEGVAAGLLGNDERSIHTAVPALTRSSTITRTPSIRRRDLRRTTTVERFIFLVGPDAVVVLARLFLVYPGKDVGAIFAASSKTGAGASGGSSIPHQ
jgi:hypothetical protein